MRILFRFKSAFFMNFSLFRIFFNFLYKSTDIDGDSNPRKEWRMEPMMGIEMEVGGKFLNGNRGKK